MERKERWQYYISSYLRIEPTEGVPRNRLHKTVLTRNIPADSIEFEGALRRRPLEWCENLTLRVCVNTYKIIFRDPGYEFQIFTDKSLGMVPGTETSLVSERLGKVEAIRTQRFKEKFEMNNAWMKGLDHDEVANVSLHIFWGMWESLLMIWKANNEFKKWMDDGTIPEIYRLDSSPAPVATGDDTEMAS